MAKRSYWTRVVRGTMVLAIGGSAFQLSGCDPAVRSTLLEGLQTTTTSLSSALITAFFLSMQDDSDTTGGASLTTTP
ncbi:MAG: hypothetical protein Q7R41_07995 [Phycisphaerales bacterium]|nr:hypothetical protein [Phycisphaerales bacterium]